MIPVGGINLWYQIGVEFVVSDSISTLRFASAPAVGNDATLLLDNISIALVPEPATGLPVLLGLTVFAIWRIRARLNRMVL